MIECPNCEISFSPARRVCPRCDQYRPDLSLRRDYLRGEVEYSLSIGVAPAALEAALIQDGFSPGEASVLVRDLQIKTAGAARRYGSSRLVAGGLLVLLGVCLCILGVFGLLAVPGPRKIGYVILLGLICLGGGLRLIFLGGFNLWTGRE